MDSSKEIFHDFANKLLRVSFFIKGAQAGGRTWDLFDFRLYSLTIAAP